MAFWIIILALAAVVAGLLCLPLLRQAEVEATADPDVALYRDQLAEVDRDLARGILAPEDAERTRTEISRRLLATDASGRVAISASPKARARRLAAYLVIGIIGFPAALYYGTDRLLVSAGMSPETVLKWQDRLSISIPLPGGDEDRALWLGPIFAGLGAPGYPDIPLADRIAASEEVRETRMSQLEAEQLGSQISVPPPMPQEQQELLDGLMSIVQRDPSDIGSWERIVALNADAENFAAAARAQTQVLALKGSDTDTSDHVRSAILLILAAQGYVSPEAEAQLQVILTRDPDNLAARYYYGLLFFETDRPDRAFRLFRDVIQDGADNNPFVQLSRQLVEEAAFRAGVEYTLPPERGPTMDDITAAADMSEEDRQNMIADMVNRLSTRLANEGGPVNDWAMLINALAQLGDTDQAQEILTEARDLFATSPDAMRMLDDVANLAGLDE